jgi:bifunctional DNA-binding transcriptional regulator/antitoxin component of YhaV-PrlF toxin-antitoxin module
MTVLQIEATVRDKNQMTIPRAVAERHGIEPGRRLVIVDSGNDDEFTVRILPRSYAGRLAGVFGQTMDENVEYVRQEREDWG